MIRLEMIHDEQESKMASERKIVQAEIPAAAPPQPQPRPPPPKVAKRGRPPKSSSLK